MFNRFGGLSAAMMALFFLAQAGAAVAGGYITVASTTSTRNSGFYDHILPKFTKKTGIEVRVVAVGPGKIRLLELIDSEGGISAAGRQMGLSYRRAWHLIDTLNSALGEPVIETSVGGEGGGGARLTDTGRAVIDRYRAACKAAEESMKPFTDWLDDPDHN